MNPELAGAVEDEDLPGIWLYWFFPSLISILLILAGAKWRRRRTGGAGK